MSNRIDSLNLYLQQARVNVRGPDGGAIVMGNEAADLDSMVSAMLYGLLASSRHAPGSPSVAPVINCPRNDFSLRTEAVYLFTELNVDVAALLFIDEVDLDALHRAGRLRLTLVDHNILAAAQEQYAEAVDAILDHHKDGGLYPRANPRVVEPVGSAATLVAEAILQEKPDLVDAGSATLLLGTILLDTVNLAPGAGRVTAKDRDVAARLRELAGVDGGELFAALEAEKFNVSALGTGDLLRKDYKSWDSPAGTYGISTVLTSLEAWVAKDPGLVAGLDDFLRSKGLVCLLAMLAYTDAEGGFHRELIVCAPEAGLAAGLTATLEAGDLALTPIQPAGLMDTDRVMFFAQRNAAISRKKLQPLIDRFFSERSAD